MVDCIELMVLCIAVITPTELDNKVSVLTVFEFRVGTFVEILVTTEIWLLFSIPRVLGKSDRVFIVSLVFAFIDGGSEPVLPYTTVDKAVSKKTLAL